MADFDELENLRNLMELLRAKDELEKSVTETQTELDGLTTREQKKDAQTKLDGFHKELDDIKAKLEGQRQSINTSWSKTTLQTKPETQGSVSESREEDEIREIPCSSASSTYNFKLPKPEKFQRGQNFTRFCNNFEDYVKLARIKDDNLNIYFLSLLDDFTKDKLKKITLSPDQRKDAGSFIPIFIEKMTPRHEAENLKLQLSDIRQSAGESIEDFAFRLREMASRAYSTDEEASKLAACYSAFLKGLSNKELRIKLRENTRVTDFELAVDEASRLHVIRESEIESRDPISLATELQILQIEKEDSRADRRNQDSSFSRNSNRDSNARTNQAQSSNSLNQRQNISAHPRNTYRHSNVPQTPEYGRGRFNQPHNRRNRNGRDEIICYKCNQPNHISRNCTLNC